MSSKADPSRGLDCGGETEAPGAKRRASRARPVRTDPESKRSPPCDKTSSSSSSLPARETVTVLDWDDTLLPSSWLASNGYRLDTQRQVPSFHRSQLKRLARAATRLCEAALKQGPVLVITNAERGWVELSAQKFMPGVLDVLKRMTVISARSSHEDSFPDNPLQWKFQAFSEKLPGAFERRRAPRNTISFGDSHIEREVVKAVARTFSPDTYTKSIKLAECPSIEQLTRQVRLCAQCYDEIWGYAGDLDLMLAVDTAQDVADSNTCAQSATTAAVGPRADAGAKPKAAVA